MADELLYKSIDHNYVKHPIAYCKAHKGYLTRKQMKVHRCVARHCIALRECDDSYWEERRKRKQEAKEKRKELYRK
jgi:hypothetical protein